MKPTRQSLYQSYTIFLLFLLWGLSLGCKTTATGTETAPTTSTTETQVSQDPEKDPYFTEKSDPGEVLRILITPDFYIVKQVAYDDAIHRRPDDQGDKEQGERFSKTSKEYDFKDWTITGLLRLKLNPNTGMIEHVENVINPKTWQASVDFQSDVQRFRFDFPEGKSPMREILVRYEWRIPRQPGITPEESRARAIEFLRSQVREGGGH